MEHDNLEIIARLFKNREGFIWALCLKYFLWREYR